jgi:4-diphosphocytidyl-2-C-methyl-D-erythritol kinase
MFRPDLLKSGRIALMADREALAPALWYPAPAKLNLFLHVIGRRPDGYHELQTVFRFLDHGDRLGIRVRTDGAIVRANEIPGVPMESDLCVRAARLLQQHASRGLGADILLDKQLPMGGGLGGGSSDAATVLIVLNRLWGLDLGRQSLAELGLALGADVPVFVFGENAFAEGVGERLAPITLPPAWYLVLVPPVLVPTGVIFSDPELTRNSNRITMSAFFAGELRNDFEPVVCRLFPVVGDYLEWLRRHAPARLTGSGACVFASFDSEHRAREVLAALPSHMQGFVARGLEHHPLRAMILGSRQAG